MTNARAQRVGFFAVMEAQDFRRTVETNVAELKRHRRSDPNAEAGIAELQASLASVEDLRPWWLMLVPVLDEETWNPDVLTPSEWFEAAAGERPDITIKPLWWLWRRHYALMCETRDDGTRHLAFRKLTRSERQRATGEN